MQIYRRFTVDLNGVLGKLSAEKRNGSIVAVLLYCALVLLAVWVGDTEAAAPGDLYSGTVPVPLGDSSGNLVSQTIDATVEEANDGVWVTVESRFLIASTDPEISQPVTVSLPVALPGGLVFDPDIFSAFEVTANGEKRTLTPLEMAVPEATSPITSAYTLALLPSPDNPLTTLEMRYRQYLGDQPDVTFRFATALGARWTGDVGSSRITVKFPWVTTLEQVLAVQPPDVAFDGQQVVWYYSDFEPTVDVVLTFVKPSLWQQIVQARISVTEAPESAVGHYDLAMLYRQVVQSRPGMGILESFRDMMMAEFEAALKYPAAVPSDVLCEIRQEMQGFYLAKMRRADGTVDTAYLVQAVGAFQDSAAMCPQNQIPPEVTVQIEEGYLYLAHEARRQGRYETALTHLEAAEVLHRNAGDTESEFLRNIETERHLSFLSWVFDLLRRGEIDTAIAVAERGGISESALADWDTMPRVGSIQMSVQTEATQRRILMGFTPFPVSSTGMQSPPALERLLRALETSADVHFTTTVSTSDAGTYLLETVIPFGSGVELLEAQRVLATTLPDWPELAFAKAVLLPVKHEILMQESWFSKQESYQEVVGAVESQAILGGQLQVCEERLRALDGAQVGTDSESVQSELDLVRREILSMAREGWGRLGDTSRAVFSLSWTSLTGEHIERTWTVGVGQEQDMRLGSQVYDWTAIGIAVGLVVLGVVIVVLILSLLARVQQ